MAQHDYTLDLFNNAGAPNIGEINSALQAVVSQNSGATEPVVPYAYQSWADTANDVLKVRNSTNDGWVSVYTLSTGKPISAGRLETVINSADVAGITQVEWTDVFLDDQSAEYDGYAILIDFTHVNTTTKDITFRGNQVTGNSSLNISISRWDKIYAAGTYVAGLDTNGTTMVIGKAHNSGSNGSTIIRLELGKRNGGYMPIDGRIVSAADTVASYDIMGRVFPTGGIKTLIIGFGGVAVSGSATLIGFRNVTTV